jgi:hypothetical protein
MGRVWRFNSTICSIKGAFAEQPDGTYTLNVEKFKQGVRDLDHNLLTLEAEGDYAASKKMIEELGVIRPSLKKAFVRLQGIPVDIELVFVTADELAPVTPPAPVKVSRKKKTRRD